MKRPTSIAPTTGLWCCPTPATSTPATRPTTTAKPATTTAATTATPDQIEAALGPQAALVIRACDAADKRRRIATKASHRRVELHCPGLAERERTVLAFVRENHQHLWEQVKKHKRVEYVRENCGCSDSLLRRVLTEEGLLPPTKKRA